MGKLVAIGGGDYANGELDTILRHMVGLVDKKEPSLIFLPTASFDMISQTDAEIVRLRELGCRLQPLYLSDKTLSPDDIRDTILGADILYAGGGNLQFLVDTWTRAGAIPHMREAYRRGTVLAGYSSGAMCWFRRGYDDCGKDHAFVFVDALGILPFCHCPHFENESWHSFARRVREQPLCGIAAENGAAFCAVDGECYTLCGADGGDVFFFDAENDYAAHSLTGNPAMLQRVERMLP